MTTPLQTSEKTPAGALLRPFQEFAQWEASGGVVLLACAVAALAWANSPWAGAYAQFWNTKLMIGFGGAALDRPLAWWINDGLMAVFFFVVGLEIKRELLVGELASPRKAALPLLAALGGMAVPAALYAVFNAGHPGARGWGIPMATDIAFALGVLALLGKRVPVALKVFLAALAIADDLGAVLVIAVFYTSSLSWAALAAGGCCLLFLVAANIAGVRNPLVYAALGVGLWLACLYSGIHPTVAGVLLALTIPARARIRPGEFLRRGRALLAEFQRAGDGRGAVLTTKEHHSALHGLKVACDQAWSPMMHFEHALAPWVTFAVIPLFALANAGVSLGAGFPAALVHPVSLGVAVGLILGKPLGITLFAWLAVRFNWAELPQSVCWRHIWGVGWLGGIGFTMSLFIADLAFEQTPLLSLAKAGILVASLIGGAVGLHILYWTKGAGAPSKG